MIDNFSLRVTGTFCSDSKAPNNLLLPPLLTEASKHIDSRVHAPRGAGFDADAIHGVELSYALQFQNFTTPDWVPAGW